MEKFNKITVDQRKKSGAQKRKENLERKKKDDEVVAKVRKVTEFFSSNKKNTNISPDESLPSVTNVVSLATNQQDQHPVDVEVAEQADQQTVEVEQQQNVDLNNNMVTEHYPTDISLWPKKLSEIERVYWSVHGSESCRNLGDGTFPESLVHYKDGKNRKLTRPMFTRKHALTGETYDREWLCYSPQSGKVFCFVCCLHPGANNVLTHGYNDWKNIGATLSSHDESPEHRDAIISLLQRSSPNALNETLVSSYKNEAAYWKKVLTRVISTIKFISARGLAFRGTEEKFGSVNNGNYIGILELLAEYDPFLESHIRTYANKGRGQVSYLSKTICDEIINLMGEEVTNEIVKELKEAKYYSISVDSTPDLSHTDQLTFCVRYVNDDGPVERFMRFIPMFSHTGIEIAQIILGFLRKQGIEVKDCRDQSYDNAKNMSGEYNGVQAHILSHCKYADFVPCSAHSLNLVGNSAAESCPTASRCFEFVGALYTWFSASTHRWAVLVKHLGRLPVPKKLSDTRWSARHDAVKALCAGYTQILEALNELKDDERQKPAAKVEAEGFWKKLRKIETVIFLLTWNEILERFHATNLVLQEEGLSLNAATLAYKSLKDFISSLRSEKKYDDIEARALELAEVKSYKEKNSRKRKRKAQFDEGPSSDSSHDFSPRDSYRVKFFYAVIDNLVSCLAERSAAYEKLDQKFGFLSSLEQLDDAKLTEAAENLIKCYPEDFETKLIEELKHFAKLFKLSEAQRTAAAINQDGSSKKKKDICDDAHEVKVKELRMLHLLTKQKFAPSYPNVHVLLRIYLCMMVSNCTGERSFSKMKRIKNELRTTMSQERFSNLSLLSIEHELLNSLCFDHLIEKFSLAKARRKPI